MTSGFVTADGYNVQNVFDGKGNWIGYKVSAIPPVGNQGTLYPTGKDGKGIELKKDANHEITPDNFNKA